MESKESLLKRRSVRKFLNKEITDEQIKSLLEAAMAAPSAINKQPWEFYVIKDKSTQERIKNLKAHYSFNSPLLIVVAGNKDRFIPEAPEFWIEDCAAATENILIEATNLGLGSVWCGIYPVKERVISIKEILNLPDNIIPFGLIHIGYPDETKDARSQYDNNKIHIIK